jgi:hypothetical protein
VIENFSRRISMRVFQLIVVAVVALLVTQSAVSQPTRIDYNKQKLFLNGANLAWVSFASDIGPGTTDFNRFADVMLQMHDRGGNAMRWWLHTTGANTPQFNDTGVVIGPGAGTIQDMKKVLDLAWHREIGINLCLWSFDMLNNSNSAAVLARNKLLLNDTNYTRAYINNCLIPMVDSLKGNPAVLCWEIFNEPEGMSNEFGWSAQQHVPMATIQRFINMCTGAIHREDPTALVTSGSWSFYAMTDVVNLVKVGPSPELSSTEKRQLETLFAQKYRFSLSADEITAHLDKAAAYIPKNYYRDDRLKAAGGDSAGTLDFYSVHYYSGISGKSDISPFHHNRGYWGLNKPVVVAEFAEQNTFGIPKQSLYDTLYAQGYAGALAWSWTDVTISTSADMLASMQSMWDNHRADVDVLGIGGAWPLCVITSPKSDTTFADTAQVQITATATDTDGTVVKVEFFAADTVKIGEALTPPYTMVWKKPTLGINVLTAVATDNTGNQRISNKVIITVGKPVKMHIEAERGAWAGSGFSVKSDNSASGGAYVDIAGQTGTLTWKVPGVTVAGTYELSLGYKLSYASPKSQIFHVNGARADTIAFTGASTTTWYEKTFTEPLVQGDNTVQMELFWGWMCVDYLGVPNTAFVTGVKGQTAGPRQFALEQNYPNPFNPATTIRYALAENSIVTLKVYDIVGRTVATLVDGRMTAGTYSAQFDGSKLSSGVYMYRLTATHGQSTFTETKRFIFMK